MSRRLLGLDPGLQHMGWGIITLDMGHLKHVAHGVITTSSKISLPRRLSLLYEGLLEVIEIHRPTEAAVEETFVNKNPASTLKLGMARGIALLTPASRGLNVQEYSANKVKKALVGAGHADKNQVQAMIKVLLPGLGEIPADAADALAVAICHLHHGGY